MAYISKKQQVLNILADLQATITSRNVDIGINILNWAKEKIILAEKENKRQYYLQKFPTDTRNKPRVVKYGRVYGCNLGKNVGSEQNGKSRPVIVLQKDSPNSPTHVLVQDPNLTKQSIIKLEHMRSISKNRLTEYMTDLSKNNNIMQDIEKKLKSMLRIK